MKTIYKDEEKIKRSISAVNRIVEAFNNNSKRVDVNIDDVRLMLEDVRKYKDKVFLEELERVCDMFAQDFDEVKLKSYAWQNPMFSKMANNKCKDLYKLADEVCKAGRNMAYLAKYLELDNGLLSPVLGYEDLIKDAFTYKTNNKKQDEVVEALNNVAKDFKKLEALGISPIMLHNYFYNNYELRPTAIYKY